MSNELRVAIEAAKEAGEILMNYYLNHASIVIEAKGKVDRVSIADKKSEEKIREILQNHFPSHRIIGEEFGDNKKASEYVWYIDPLCGTFNFLHSFPEFVVSIGLAFREDPIIGIVFAPSFNELFWAEKGKGTFLNGEKTSVSKVQQLYDAMFLSDMSSDLAFRKEQITIIGKIAQRVQYIRLLGSSYTFCNVARGRADGYVELYVPPLHRVAGVLIAMEAGGRVTNLHGSKLLMNDDHLVVTNGLLHDEVIKILNE